MAEFLTLALVVFVVAALYPWIVAKLRLPKSGGAPEPATTKPRDQPSPNTEPRDQPSPTTEAFHQYEARPMLLTEPEQVLFRRLLAALPNHTIAVQVQLSQVIRPALTFERQAAQNRINRKSLDFLVLDRATQPIVAIELDDASHSRKDRKKADEVKSRALESAGVRLIRYQVESLPGESAIARDVGVAAPAPPPLTPARWTHDSPEPRT